MTSHDPASPSISGAIDVSRLRMAIVRLARRQRQHAETGLTPTLQSALAVIDVQGPLTLGELATFEQVEPPTITRIVSKLEETGLVLRFADPEDGRICRVDLTVEGRRQLHESRERRDRWLRDRLDELDVGDIDALAAAIAPLERLLESAKRPETAR
jgi:DNA-binding MarR family transcriptional regulator